MHASILCSFLIIFARASVSPWASSTCLQAPIWVDNKCVAMVFSLAAANFLVLVAS